ncbi:hypothetical protein HYT05_04850 [Candidatus Kaiserbacteria bacterium]|nr:hypothetical protein [Candidatus Kaiserbacteria bacterium]
MAQKVGGWQDWHCHDRVNTYEDQFFDHEGGLNEYIDASLPVKQDAVGVLHRGRAYTEESLEIRLRKLVEAKKVAGETVLYLITDCSPDIEERSFRVALRLRKEYADQGFDIKVGAYAIFGFKHFGSEYHRHIEKLAPEAQFLVGLPERDENHPVGFDGHLAILIDLAIKYQIPLQVHVDQTGDPNENGTEQLIDAVHWRMVRTPAAERPRVWAVHMLSPASYDEPRWWNLVRGLKKHNIGVIVCPRATISDRQIRSLTVPMHNSITRVKELLVAGIDLRWGTDNINDLFMPTPKSPLLMREIGEEYGVIQDAIRFYDQTVFEKIARGERLLKTDLARIERSLKGDYAAAGWYGQRPWRNL